MFSLKVQTQNHKTPTSKGKEPDGFSTQFIVILSFEYLCQQLLHITFVVVHGKRVNN